MAIGIQLKASNGKRHFVSKVHLRSQGNGLKCESPAEESTQNVEKQTAEHMNIDQRRNS